jgi:putative two-component system response regulator
VEIATAGNQAIEKLKQLGAELNLILLDIILPEKNGYEILTFIQEDPKLKTVPVVVLSNLGQEEKIQKAKQLGAKDFMIKAQTDTDQIVVKVKQYLT